MKIEGSELLAQWLTGWLFAGRRVEGQPQAPSSSEVRPCQPRHSGTIAKAQRPRGRPLGQGRWGGALVRALQRNRTSRETLYIGKKVSICIHVGLFICVCIYRYMYVYTCVYRQV